MPYSTEYKEERYVEIERYIEKAESLKEGESFIVPTKSEEHRKHLKWLFYDYFQILGIPKTYTLQIVWEELILGKRYPKLSQIRNKSNEAKSMTGEFSKILQQLILSPRPRETLSRLVEDENLSYEALSIILSEFGRVMQE